MKESARKKRFMIPIYGMAMVVIALTLFSSAVFAQPFYQGKTIRIMVPFGPGGGTDTYARFVARHWGKYIPGKPNILVESKPGGGGALAFMFLYSQAEADGLTLGIASEGIPPRWLLRLPGHHYDLRRMHLIAASPSSTVHFARKDLGVSKLVDLRKVKGPIKMGDTQKGSTIATAAQLIFDLLGVRYEQVYGYGSYGEARLALLRGEVNVSGGDAFDYPSAVAPLEKKGELTVLFQSGLLDSQGNIVRHPSMTHILTVEEAYREIFGREPSGKTWEAIKGMVAINTLGKSFWTPPKTPETRLRNLGSGYRSMLKSSEYQKDALKILRTEDQALIGKEAEPALKLFLGLPKEVIDLYR